MTDLTENVLMITGSLGTLGGKWTAKALKEECEWLRNYSLYGIDVWLNQGRLKGYIKEYTSFEEVKYMATAKGRRACEYYHNTGLEPKQ